MHVAAMKEETMVYIRIRILSKSAHVAAVAQITPTIKFRRRNPPFVLCSEGKIEVAELFGKTWYIPNNALKPVDGRIKIKNTYLKKIIELKK